MDLIVLEFKVKFTIALVLFLHPQNDNDKQIYAQLYILDPSEASDVRLRMQENNRCNHALMTELSQFMSMRNPFAQAFKMLYEVEQQCIQDAEVHGVVPAIVQMAILQDRNQDQRRYNAPTVNEVAVVFRTDTGEPPLERDLIIHCRSMVENSVVRKTERINVLDPNLDLMTYPLLFPYGDQSWGINIPLRQILQALRNLQRVAENQRQRVTQMQYYGYRFSIRDEFNPF